MLINSFYRKLDVLNRVYVLNYFDLNMLENSSILRVPDTKHIDLNLLKSKSYFNLADIRLVIASFSSQKITTLFNKVLLYMVSTDTSIALDAKVLSKLKHYLGLNELDFNFMKQALPVTGPTLRHILSDYTIEEVIAHLKHVYFKQLHKFLPRQVEQRFWLLHPEDKLIDSLNSYDLDEIVSSQFSQCFVSANAIIQELARH